MKKKNSGDVFLGYRTSQCDSLEILGVEDDIDPELYGDVLWDFYCHSTTDFKVDRLIEMYNPHDIKNRLLGEGYAFYFISDYPIRPNMAGKPNFRHGLYTYWVWGTGKEYRHKDFMEGDSWVIMTKDALYFEKIDGI
jgi:hypothetical protein